MLELQRLSLTDELEMLARQMQRANQQRIAAPMYAIVGHARSVKFSKLWKDRVEEEKLFGFALLLLARLQRKFPKSLLSTRAESAEQVIRQL